MMPYIRSTCVLQGVIPGFESDNFFEDAKEIVKKAYLDTKGKKYEIDDITFWPTMTDARVYYAWANVPSHY